MDKISSIYNEQTLKHRLAEGDPGSFRTFFNHWWPLIYENALRFSKSPHMAEDMAQEVFIKIWVNREKLAEVKSLENYLFFIARNVFLDHLKKKVLHIENDSFLNTWFEDKAASILHMLEGRETETIILQAIDALPPQMQQVFRLSRLEGLTHEQIAQKMQISKATSQSYIVRALVLIRKHLAENNYPLGPLSFYLLLKLARIF